MQEKGIPRHGYKIYSTDGTEAGQVTSGTMSPSMGIGIGLGYVKTGLDRPGSEILIGIRDKHLKAMVVPLPLFKKLTT